MIYHLRHILGTHVKKLLIPIFYSTDAFSQNIYFTLTKHALLPTLHRSADHLHGLQEGLEVKV